MNQMWYTRGESRFSDHRPVHSLFSVELDDHDNYRPRPTINPTPNIMSETRNNSNSNPTAGNAAAVMLTSNGMNASNGKVQLEEMLLVARTQSCLQASRF